MTSPRSRGASRKDSSRAQRPPLQCFSHTYVQVVRRLLGLPGAGQEGAVPSSALPQAPAPQSSRTPWSSLSSHHSSPCGTPSTYNPSPQALTITSKGSRGPRPVLQELEGQGEGERKTGERVRSEAVMLKGYLAWAFRMNSTSSTPSRLWFL